MAGHASHGFQLTPIAQIRPRGISPGDHRMRITDGPAFNSPQHSGRRRPCVRLCPVRGRASGRPEGARAASSTSCSTGSGRIRTWCRIRERWSHPIYARDRGAIEAVRAAVGEDVKSMVDFKQGLSLGDALHCYSHPGLPHAARPHIFTSHPLACATMPSWSNVLAFWKKSGTEIM